jgi:hypothetical protein
MHNFASRKVYTIQKQLEIIKESTEKACSRANDTTG